MAILAMVLGLGSATVVAEIIHFISSPKHHGKLRQYDYYKDTDRDLTTTRFHVRKIDERTGQATIQYEYEVSQAGYVQPLTPKEAENRYLDLAQVYDLKHIKEHPEKCPVYPVKPAVPAGYMPLSSGMSPFEMDMDGDTSRAVQKQSAKSAFQIIFGNCSGCIVGKE